MSDYLMKIPRISDRSLINCMSKIYSSFPNQPKKFVVRLIGGIDAGSVFDQEALPEILEEALNYNTKLINQFNAEIAQLSVTYMRGGFNNQNSAVYDEIKIVPGNTTLKPKQKLNIISTLLKELNAFDPSREPSGILSEEQQSQLDIHLSTIKTLEDRIAELSTKITNELLENSQKLQNDYIEKQAQLSKKYAEDRSEMEKEFNSRYDEIREKANILAKREQELDLKDNTTARRGLRNDFLKAITDRFSNFQLTDYTRKLRTPIHLVCLLIIGLSIFASISFAKEFIGLLSSEEPIPSLILILLGTKQIAFTLIAGSTLIFYLKWMYRWFDKHAQSEFHLKQLQFDFERANWLVETVLEWRKENQDKMPVELLLSLTNNLFSGGSYDNEDHTLHPSDQLAKALMGNAAKVKVKAGNADIELSGKGIQKAEKELQKSNE